MKLLKVLKLLPFTVLAGCGLLNDDDYFAEVPSKYLINEQGQYIDLNGNVVKNPVVNPYYEKYMKSGTVIMKKVK